jgi:hypothetical protein
MPWYKAGTVSVTQNSNAVIGTGTAFIANSRVGDAFRGPDGGWYEVSNIASDSAMSISPNYQGPTNAAGVYALAPMQGYVKDSADALRALVNQFGEQLAALTDTDGLLEGPTNKYFTDARVRGAVLQGLVTTDAEPVVAADTLLTGIGKLQAQVAARLPLAGGKMTGAINAATPVPLASAATVDIGAAASNVITISGTTAITSLGTIAAGAIRKVRFLAPLVLTYNVTSMILPTGASITTAANDTAEFLSLGGGNWFCLNYIKANGKALAKDFAYDRANTVGTVAQVSGVPTNALMEIGSNANGTFWRFANGLQICIGSLISGGTASVQGSIYVSTPASGSFPIAFVAAPVVVASGLYNASGMGWATQATFQTAAIWGSWAVCFGASNGSASTIYLMAIGRWF